jgi:hypothetical protein
VATQWILHHVKQGKPFHHQDALHVPEDHGHLFASRGSCLKFLGLTAPAAGKQMAIVFWDPEGILLVEWHPIFDKLKDVLCSTDSLTTITSRVVSASGHIVSQNSVFHIHQEVTGTRKMVTVH